ncbi:single-stranded DNA-binding protein [bacterium]|nr:single-stranded DNA-binding protein [bacterium]
MSVRNRVVLIGRLVRDPETRTIASGQQVTNFTIAVDRTFGRSSDQGKTADFIPIDTWNNLAVTCSKYLTKGREVAIEGRLRIDSQKQPDGTYRTFVSVVADDMQMLGSRSDSYGGGDYQSRDSYRAQETRSSAPDPLDMDSDLGESDMDVPF